MTGHSQPTLTIWSGRFIDDLSAARRCSAHTVRAYRRELDRFFEHRKDAAATIDRVFSPRRLQDFLASLAVAGLSNRSIARSAAVLRAFLNFLHGQGATHADWSERVPSVKFAAGLPRFVGEPQMQQWLESLPSRTRWERRDRCLITLMYATGARVAEIVGLNWGDFDAPAQTARLFGKRQKERLVPTGHLAAEVLQQLAEASPEAATASGRPVFVNPRGSRLTTRSVARILQRTFARTVGGRVSPHRLRHSCATHMLDHGADLLSLQQLLGHQNVATTQIYTHTTPHRLAEVYRQHFPAESEK